MKIYDKLIAAEIYRDGGSLEARFRFADGGFESLWLSVLPWDTPAQIAYGDLRVAFDSEGAELSLVSMGGFIASFHRPYFMKHCAIGDGLVRKQKSRNG